MNINIVPLKEGESGKLYENMYLLARTTYPFINEWLENGCGYIPITRAFGREHRYIIMVITDIEMFLQNEELWCSDQLAGTLELYMKDFENSIVMELLDGR